MGGSYIPVLLLVTQRRVHVIKAILQQILHLQTSEETPGCVCLGDHLW